MNRDPRLSSHFERIIANEKPDDDVLDNRKYQISQFIEVYIHEVVEQSRREVLTPEILQEMIDKLAYFSFYFQVIKVFSDQMDAHIRHGEVRKSFLAARQHLDKEELDEAVKNFDREWLPEFEQIRQEQQRRLLQIGMPGFAVTTDSRQIQLQQLLLGLVMEIEPNSVYFREDGDTLYF